MAECRLCKQNKELRRSHVLPEFCYDACYGLGHTGNILNISTAKKVKFQIGLREYLFCDPCEQFLNDHYEKYFHSVWYDQSLIPKVIPPGEFTVSGLDYRRFKLFHLSVLWRAGIASRPEFKNVMLGPRHEEELRKMLLSRDPGHPDKYGLWCYLVVHPTTHEVMHGVVLEPELRLVRGHHVYIFVFGGAVWFYVVSSHKKTEVVPSEFDISGILRTGVLTINQDNFIMDAFSRFFEITEKLDKG